MANTQAAKKAARVSERRRIINKRVSSEVKTAVKKARAAILSHHDKASGEPAKVDGDSSGIASVVSKTQSLLDKAAKKGTIHPNKAARYKSRLMKRFGLQSEKG